MMERLTERIGGKLVLKKKFPSLNDAIEILAERLELYEDAEEEGRLIKIPCKVGDTAYANISGNKGDYIDECKVWNIEFNKDFTEPLFTAVCIEKAEYRTFWASDFGKEIFIEPQFAPVKKRNKR